MSRYSTLEDEAGTPVKMQDPFVQELERLREADTVQDGSLDGVGAPTAEHAASGPRTWDELVECDELPFLKVHDVIPDEFEPTVTLAPSAAASAECLGQSAPSAAASAECLGRPGSSAAASAECLDRTERKLSPIRVAALEVVRDFSLFVGSVWKLLLCILTCCVLPRPRRLVLG